VEYVFDNERPIYVQLVEIIRIEIVSGKLKKGDRLPSVRELALIMQVNPNTMQKALAELEDDGLARAKVSSVKDEFKDDAIDALEGCPTSAIEEVNK